jgi:hypothetical protein
MSQFANQLRAVSNDIRTTRILTAVNDRCFSWDHARAGWNESWIGACEHRGPYTFAQIRELCIATHGSGLGPYVVLWIVNWLPRKWLIADLQKLRWAEGVMASIQRVLAARHLLPPGEPIKQAKIE